MIVCYLKNNNTKVFEINKRQSLNSFLLHYFFSIFRALCNTKSNTEMLTEHQQDNNTKSAWEHIKQRFSQTYLT